MSVQTQNPMPSERGPGLAAAFPPRVVIAIFAILAATLISVVFLLVMRDRSGPARLQIDKTHLEILFDGANSGAGAKGRKP